MNDRQRKVLLCGVIAAAVAGLFPPWRKQDGVYFSRPVGYYFIFDSPNGEAYLDFRRLFLEWGIIALVATIPLLIPQRPKGNSPKASGKGEQKPQTPPPREPMEKESVVDARRPLYTYVEPMPDFGRLLNQTKRGLGVFSKLRTLGRKLTATVADERDLSKDKRQN
jgi:hypothetical protein